MPFWPPALAQQAPPAIILAALRRFRGAALFHGPRPSSGLGAPFWPSGLTVRRSRPPAAAAELNALAPLKTCFIQAHVYSNGIHFLKRCAALGLPFLRASPAGIASFSSLFGF